SKGKARFQGHTDEVWCLALSRDGRRAASGSRDKTARVWDVHTGKQLHSLRHPLEVRGVALSPDGRVLATGCYDALVRLYDAETGALRHVLRGHTFRIMCVAFAPDGKHVASVGGTGVAGMDTTV